jgi:transketolase
MAYGNLGYSHHAIQDIAILRTMPGISVLSPADPGEAKTCVEWLCSNPCPSYLRIGKAGEPDLHPPASRIDIPIVVEEGNGQDAIVSCGSILKTAMDWANHIPPAQRPAVLSMPMVKPITSESIGTLSNYRRILVLEEHVVEGGLFAALTEKLPTPAAIFQCALLDETNSLVGSQEWLRAKSFFSEKFDCFLNKP